MSNIAPSCSLNNTNAMGSCLDYMITKHDELANKIVTIIKIRYQGDEKDKKLKEIQDLKVELIKNGFRKANKTNYKSYDDQFNKLINLGNKIIRELDPCNELKILEDDLIECSKNYTASFINAYLCIPEESETEHVLITEPRTERIKREKEEAEAAKRHSEFYNLGTQYVKNATLELEAKYHGEEKERLLTTLSQYESFIITRFGKKT